VLSDAGPESLAHEMDQEASRGDGALHDLFSQRRRAPTNPLFHFLLAACLYRFAGKDEAAREEETPRTYGRLQRRASERSSQPQANESIDSRAPPMIGRG